MKNAMRLLVVLLLVSSIGACKKESGSIDKPASGAVTGKVTDLKGNVISDAKIIIEHTVWYDSYVETTSDANGFYKASLPADPAGSWTAKAQLSRSAYGQQYIFDLDPSSTNPFTRDGSAVRNFTWKLSGPRPADGGDYGAHADLYQFGTDVELNKVKLVFTPYPGETTLIDGSTAATIERNVEDVAGTLMVKDIPIGKYLVHAVYPGKTLLLDNRHEEDQPEINKTVVFGKYGNLAETEYNIEFWISE